MTALSMLSPVCALQDQQPHTPREHRFLGFFQEQIEKYRPPEEFLAGMTCQLNDEAILLCAAPEIPQIPVLRSLVFWGLRELALAEEVASDLMLAFEEALANVVRHSYAESDNKWVQIRLRREGSELYLELWDRGPLGRDPALLPLIAKERSQGRPPFKRRGGMGLYLMHRLLTHVHYEIGPEENLLTMIKQLNETPTAHPTDP